MANIVACDIDHTLSDAWWRDGMIGVKTWDEYHDAGQADFPLREMVELIKVLATRYVIVGLTARPEKWRSQTNRWLMDNYVPMNHLLMRPDDDHRSSPLVKMDLLETHTPLSEVAFILEDRSDVASAFVEKQVTVLQVHARRRA